jgi:hypothetical protein
LNSEASQIRAAVPINKGGSFFRFETACLEKNAAMTTMTCSIACLPARAFPRFQWRGGTAPHARSEITLGSNAHGATPAVMKGARKRNAGDVEKRKGGYGRERRACSRSRFVASSAFHTSAPAHHFVREREGDRDNWTLLLLDLDPGLI